MPSGLRRLNRDYIIRVVKAWGSNWDGHTPLVDTAHTDLVISGSNVRIPPSSAPTTTTWLTDLSVLLFTQGDYVNFEGMQLPHGYVPGSDILFHVHFANDSNITDGETVIWTVDISAASINFVFPATAEITCTFTNNSTWRDSLTTEQAASVLSGTTVVPNSHLIAIGGTIDGTDFTLSAVVMGKLEYSASSTYGDGVMLVSADGHIQLNRLGSENEFTG